MKILLISSYLPYPLFSGGHIRLYNIIKRLHDKGYEITLLCEKRSHQTEQDIAEVAKICKQIITVDRKKQWSLDTILQAGFSKDPFLIAGHTNGDLQSKIKEVLEKNTFDLIHVETSYVMQNIPQTALPIVLVEHNIEYLVYERFMRNAPLPIRPLLAIDIMKLKKAEQAFWKRATHIVTVSEKEKAIIGMPNVSVVPNGVDIQKFTFRKNAHRGGKSEFHVLFIGDFKWVQNRDSVRWIVNDIHPQLTKYFRQTKKIVLWIVGKHIPNDIKEKESEENIVCDENSEKPTEEIFSDADVLLTPIRIGGGTQYKILEAMAVGTPVITTPLGVEGIEATKDKELLVGETTADLARLTAKIIDDETLYETIAQNARAFVEKNYNWETIVARLEAVYKTVVHV